MMTEPELPKSIEPLFAHNIRLWLRIWGAIQAAALVIATYVSARGPGAAVAPAALGTGIDATFVVLFIGLVAYHAIGLFAHDWLLRRRWAVLVYVPLGWVAILGAASVHGTFSLLIFGAVIQGFIFLPFAWAIVALAAVVALIAGRITAQAWRAPTGMVLTQLAAVIATGTMIGTVLFYIHRTNREATLRADLLRRLDAAQRDLADRARAAGVLEERQRLSRDIHDTLAQGFASVIRHLEAVQLAIDDPLHPIVPHLMHAQAVSRDSLVEIRRLVLALRPAELTAAPLADAIGRVTRQWSAANGVEAEFDAEPLPSLHPDADVIFLRAAQEALSNVARHATAAHVRVTLGCVDQLVQLAVEDDGCGFDHADAPGRERLGLTGMRERLRPMGGHLLIESRAGMGTSLTVVLPLAAAVAGRAS